MKQKGLEMGRLKEKSTPYVLIFPTMILVLLIIAYPLVSSFIVSLSDSVFTKLDSSSFIEFQNYKKLLSDELFIKSIKITLYFVVVSVFFELIIGMIMALVLNIGLKGSGFTRALLVIPWALPGTVVAGMWRFLFQSDYGFVNGVLRLLGFNADILWLSSSPLAIHAVIFAEVWRMAPFFGLILLSGLSTVPNELYEAGRVDGANEWQMFWRITIPLMKPVIGVVLIIRTIFTFQNLEMVYVMTKGGPGSDTFLLPYYMYRVSFVNMKIGYGSAIAYYILVLIGIFCVFYIFGLVRQTDEREK